MTQKKPAKQKSLSNEKKAKMLLRHLVDVVWKNLLKKGVTKIDSNYFHVVIYDVIQKDKELKKFITYGWYYHGPYIWFLDDILVDTFGMDPKYHQMTGDESCKFDTCETEHMAQCRCGNMDAGIDFDTTPISCVECGGYIVTKSGCYKRRHINTLVVTESFK